MTTFAELGSEERAELWAALALRHAKGIGAVRARVLLERYASALAAVEACRKDARAWAEQGLLPLGLGRDFADEHWREGAKREWEAVRGSAASVLLWTDARYPALLRELPDAPLFLYCRGDMSLLSGPGVAVVGSRNCTREGMEATAFFSRNLSKAGITVISGMAKGIDRVAHLAGLEGPGGSIAVLGAGIDQPYPQGNADLARLLTEKGLLISEFAPGVKPQARHFPIRNRLISGLSHGVLVVEAAARSGSLITARLALEQGREVYAVPGRIAASMSEGCRGLIRSGAKPVFTADDIIIDLLPLLAAGARAAHEERRLAEERQRRKSPPRRPADHRHEEELVGAQTVLPGGGLPWAAPDGAPPGKASRGGAGKQAARAPQSVLLERRAALSREEQGILAALGGTVRHVDELCRELGADVARLSGMLTVLEVKGLVRRYPGMHYGCADDS